MSDKLASRDPDLTDDQGLARPLGVAIAAARPAGMATPSDAVIVERGHIDAGRLVDAQLAAARPSALRAGQLPCLNGHAWV